MKTLKVKNILFSLLATLLFTVSATETTLAQITTNNGYLYFKNQNQYLKGSGSHSINFHANNANSARLYFYNNTNDKLGGVYGSRSTDGTTKLFGLVDSDGNWSYVTKTDNWTALKINNENKMIIRSNGRVDIPSTRDASGTAGTGALEIGNGLRLDNNEIITNTDGTLHINRDNNGDVAFDDSTLRVDASTDRVGIGFSAPQTKLEVRGIVRATSENTRSNRVEMGHSGSHGYINTLGQGNLYFRHDGSNMMGIKNNGKVFIGGVDTPTDNYRLYVEKGILTEKVKVAVKSTSDWSDYVFEEDYEVMPITELENFVNENKHLPNVPSAEEMVKGGLDVATMDAKLLEKIEEAHLYIIELHKQIEGLKTEVAELKK